MKTKIKYGFKLKEKNINSLANGGFFISEDTEKQLHILYNCNLTQILKFTYLEEFKCYITEEIDIASDDECLKYLKEFIKHASNDILNIIITKFYEENFLIYSLINKIAFKNLILFLDLCIKKEKILKQGVELVLAKINNIIIKVPNKYNNQRKVLKEFLLNNNFKILLRKNILQEYYSSTNKVVFNTNKDFNIFIKELEQTDIPKNLFEIFKPTIKKDFFNFLYFSENFNLNDLVFISIKDELSEIEMNFLNNCINDFDFSLNIGFLDISISFIKKLESLICCNSDLKNNVITNLLNVLLKNLIKFLLITKENKNIYNHYISYSYITNFIKFIEATKYNYDKKMFKRIAFELLI